MFELPTRVYRLYSASGRATVVIEDLTRPNGLCLSPDLKSLYVVDTGCTDNPAHLETSWSMTWTSGSNE